MTEIKISQRAYEKLINELGEDNYKVHNVIIDELDGKITADLFLNDQGRNNIREFLLNQRRFKPVQQ